MTLALTREVSCIRSLAWRCDLPTDLDWAALEAKLTATGMERRPTFPGVVRLAAANGDEILLVAASGRAQIRVHYTIPEHERRFAAERLFQRVVYALLGKKA
jgi:hypothetical protein